VLIMAAGTGGHVFPAISIAHELMSRGVYVEWLGTPTGLENDLLKGTGIPIHQVSVKGLRGSGFMRLLLAPIMLIRAFWCSLRIIGQVAPDCVLGMGGFVCGPAGLAAKLKGKPLLIHEQNAVAGLTNRLLFRISDRAMEAFPATFKQAGHVVYTGNPVRQKIIALHAQRQETDLAGRPLRLLILGGSQGAAVLNILIPKLVAKMDSELLETRHQTGKRQFDSTLELYSASGVIIDASHRVEPFIDDMSAAYGWADLVLCRSGASTVCELAAAGKPAIFIPYPYHKDNQQLLNASWLQDSNGAEVIEQKDLSLARVMKIMERYAKDPGLLNAMSRNARAAAILDASSRIASICQEVMHDQASCK